MTEESSDKQIGGSHYKDMAIQPIEFIRKNKLGFCEGNAIKYLARWKSKGGVEDLHKAVHYIEMLIEDTSIESEYNEYRLRQMSLPSTWGYLGDEGQAVACREERAVKNRNNDYSLSTQQEPDRYIM